MREVDKSLIPALLAGTKGQVVRHDPVQPAPVQPIASSGERLVWKKDSVSGLNILELPEEVSDEYYFQHKSEFMTPEYGVSVGNKSATPPVAAQQIHSQVQMDTDDTIWKKGHNVPEGTYLVKLLEIKCHNPITYKMKVEILPDALSGEGHSYGVIIGYARRDKYGHYDLANCFGDGILYKRSTPYKGGTGVIDLTDSGWITLRSKAGYPDLFPGFKALYSKTDYDNSFEGFLNLYGNQEDI